MDKKKKISNAKLREMFSLWKPAKHGDSISFEDFVDNLNKIELAINGNISWNELFLINNDTASIVDTFADLPTNPNPGTAVWVRTDPEPNKPNTVYNTLYKWLPLEDKDSDGIVDSYKWAAIMPGSIIQVGKGEQGPAGPGLTPENLTKINNLPQDTNTVLSNLQSDMGFSYIGMDRTRVILDGKHLSSYNLHGDTQSPTADDHLTDKEYVDTEVQKNKIKWLSDWYPNVQAFVDRANNYEIVKSDIDKDGNNVSSGIILLVKVGSDVKQFWTVEDAKAFLGSQLQLLQKGINLSNDNIVLINQNITALTNEQHGLRHRLDAMDTTVGGKADKTDTISLSDGWAEEQVKIIKIDGHWKNISQTLHSFADGAKVRIWHAGNESYTGYLTKSSNTHNLLIAANDFSHGPSFIGWDSSKNPDHLSLIIFNKAPNQDTYTIMENQVAITKFEVWEEPVYEYKTVLVKTAGNPIGLGGKP